MEGAVGRVRPEKCLGRHVDSQGQKIMVVLGKDRIGCRTEVPQRFQHLWLLPLWVGLAWCLAHTRRPASKHIVSSVMVIPVVLGTVLDCAGRQETLFKEKAWVHLKSILLCLPGVCLNTCVCWHTYSCVLLHVELPECCRFLRSVVDAELMGLFDQQGLWPSVHAVCHKEWFCFHIFYVE